MGPISLTRFSKDFSTSQGKTKERFLPDVLESKLNSKDTQLKGSCVALGIAGGL